MPQKTNLLISIKKISMAITSVAILVKDRQSAKPLVKRVFQLSGLALGLGYF